MRPPERASTSSVTHWFLALLSAALGTFLVDALTEAYGIDRALAFKGKRSFDYALSGDV